MKTWIFAAGALLWASTAAWPAEPFTASSLAFKNVLGVRPGDHTAYSIVGTGMFLAPRADDLDTVMAAWLKQHPQGVITVVDRMKMGSKIGEMDYIWIDDGSDSLNIDLVRKGIVPGGTMADGVDYLNSIKDAAHLDASSPDLPKRVVSDDSYEAFMRRVAVAETAARADRVGLWSDKYRAIMESEGYRPLLHGK